MRHACRYSYIVMRCDGEIVGSNIYGAENDVGKFFSDIMREEEEIRESLADQKNAVMTRKDWENFRIAVM